MTDLKYLKLLAQKYPTIQSASTEIINLQAIMSLPKGTEHFMSDLHGEYEAFLHILKNASGVIRTKIEDVYGKTLSEDERNQLATLIYYPEQKLINVKKHTENITDWYRVTLYRLTEVCRVVASKYTRSKVRKALPRDFDYIIDELLHAEDTTNKDHYYRRIIDTIIEIDRAEPFIIAISQLIQRLAIDTLHIIGDIFDRGPRADIIMDALMAHHSVDIQWGNHDIVWMGAAAGSQVCMANALRLSVSYNNFDTLEDGYGINLRPLSAFAEDVYKNDPCDHFVPYFYDENKYDPVDKHLAAKMHKAIAVIQFKLEGQLIMRQPGFHMEKRLLLSKMDLKKGTGTICGKEYPLNDTTFPTVDPACPYELSAGEKDLMQRISVSFLHSERLQRHIRFLYSKGSMFTLFNSNLLYHGCIPLTDTSDFDTVELFGHKLSGRAYLEYAERLARDAYFAPVGSKRREDGQDFIWYLWCGEKSPLFGKNRMATFERYFVDDKEVHEEVKNPYYQFVENEAVCNRILKEFGLVPAVSHIINGHVPVKIKKGESPVKAGGRLIIIDGGLSKAYQKETGIAGYTLIYNSHGLTLTAHDPFESVVRAVEEGVDLHSTRNIIETLPQRKMVADTDTGHAIQERIQDLKQLLQAYRDGTLKERIQEAHEA